MPAISRLGTPSEEVAEMSLGYAWKRAPVVGESFWAVWDEPRHSAGGLGIQPWPARQSAWGR